MADHKKFTKSIAVKRLLTNDVTQQITNQF